MDKGNKKEDFYLPSLWSYLHSLFGVNSISLGVNSKGYGDRIQTFKKA